jgi:hypothetical protein
MTDRRYTDDEVAEIFRRATADVQPRPAGSAGMSLAELQSIGREVGISDQSVALAARSLDLGEVAHTRRLLGVPVGVGETVELDRRLTDDEWDQLVVAARDAFRAKGKQRTEGSFRQWTNGNLQMLLEPGERGHRLRLQTRNENGQALALGGMATSAFGSLMVVLSVVGPEAKAAGLLTGGVILLVGGLTFLGLAVGRLPGWARRRREQFARLTARAAELTRGGST